MTGVADRLAALGESAPIRRVRNYHRPDRSASPRPRDFLTAMKRSDGAVCVRWPGPPGECVVRYADGEWECAKHDRFRGRTTVETLDEGRLRTWLDRSRPELVADEVVEAAFEAGRASLPLTSASVESDSDASNHVEVERYADLLGDPSLDRIGAKALAATLPSAPGQIAFRLPDVLADEAVLESVPGSDCVFVGERVPERETDRAYYVRQPRRECWVPKSEATTYELVDGVLLDVELPESPESA